MPSIVIWRLLLWVVALNCGLIGLLLSRRAGRAAAGYVALLLGTAGLAGLLLVWRREDHPLAWVAVGSFVFLVILPLGLRRLGNLAAGRGRWSLTLGLGHLRAWCQPGSGPAVAAELEFLRLIRDAQGPDGERVRAGLRERIAACADDRERPGLQVQLLLLLAMDRRWEEAAALGAELPSQLIAAAPQAGEVLIRAKGELGELSEVVRIMYLIEGGSAAMLAEGVDVLERCRLLTLAFLGEAERLQRFMRPGGLEPRLRYFLLAVAHHQAGLVEPARQHYQRARRLLKRRESRALQALERRLAQLDEPQEALELAEPEQAQRLVEALDARLRLSSARPRAGGSLWRLAPVTLGLVLINAVAFGAMALWRWRTGGGEAEVMIRAGASFTPAVQAGEYWRLMSANFLHAGWLHLGMNLLMLWVLGRFVEQLLGSLRYAGLFLLAGLGGAVISYVGRSSPVSLGASTALCGLLGMALIDLLLGRGRYPEAWRRTMMTMMGLLIPLSLLPGLDLPVVDNYAHVGGLLVGGAGTLVVRLADRWRPLGRAAAWLLLVLGLLASVYAGWGLLRSDLDGLPWRQTSRAGVRVKHPVLWLAHPEQRGPVLSLKNLLGGDILAVELRGDYQGEVGLDELVTATLIAFNADPKLLPGGRGRLARVLSGGWLPEGWRAILVEPRDPKAGSPVVIRAYALQGPPDTRRLWLAELHTEQRRVAKILAVYGRMLSSLAPDGS